MKLFCLSCAGASASQYYTWKKVLKDIVEIVPIDYPGHGILGNQELVTSMDILVKKVLEQIMPLSLKEPFSILGHSMGACVAYEIAKIYQYNNITTLQSLVICGSFAPNFYLTEYKYLNMISDEKFLEIVISMGGLPIELLENKEIFNYYYPIIRNDFAILGEYYPVLAKLNIPLIVLSGIDDTIVKDNYKYWNMYSNNCYFYKIHGNHFFINNIENIKHIKHI